MMKRSAVRTILAVTILTGTGLWLSGAALSQDEQETPELVEGASTDDLIDEGGLDPADFEESELIVESLLNVDIDIGRVRTESDEGDDRNAARYIKRQLQRHGGALIEACLMSLEQTPSGVVTTFEGTGVGTGSGAVVRERELRGDLLLEGRCAIGICSLRPRRSGSLGRPLASCIAESFASFLTGRPDADRRYGVRIPLRFRATETQTQVEGVD